MKTRYFQLFILTFSFILFISGCNKNTQQTPTPNLDATIQAGIVGTQIALGLLPVTGESNQASTSEAVLPTVTFTPTLHPTITLTPTQESVFLTLSRDTYCRPGAPVSSFAAIATILTGQEVEVVGINPANDSYYVKNPDADNSFCWVWGKYATLNGDQSILPVFTLQPTPTATITPTPSPSFSVTYIGINKCSSTYHLNFKITNTTSNITWESIYIKLNDTTSNDTRIHQRDYFKEYSGCNHVQTKQNLPPGEFAVVSTADPGEFHYSMAGHTVNMYISVCSKDGLGGTCTDKSLILTP